MSNEPQEFTIGKGWMDKWGYLTECDDWEHDDTAAYELNASWSELGRKRYIHVGLIDGVFSNYEPTQAQRDALWDLRQSDVSSVRMKEAIDAYLADWERASRDHT